jgi:hypothetical protein
MAKNFLTLDNLTSIATTFAKLLVDQQYAIRGTASLVLQGYDMNVDDVDIVCSKDAALAIGDIFGKSSTCGFATIETIESVAYKESPKFKSYYGKYKVNGVQVEIMGEWQICDQRGVWGAPFDASERREIIVAGQKVWVTTVKSELKMFSQMARWNAYHKILSQV